MYIWEFMVTCSSFMSEYRFTDGNMIILYALHRVTSIHNNLPAHISERVEVCLETFRIIMQSKPDNHKMMILIVSDKRSAERIKDVLINAGIDQRIIAIDSFSENVSQTFDHVLQVIKNRANPPFIYFVGSVWLRDIHDSLVIAKMKGYKVQFEGALDHRPVQEVEEEKAFDTPKKGVEYYKRKIKDKALDLLIDRIFPNKE
jgi:hypothetical protein